MTRDDIIRMAREAHHELVTQDYPGHLGQLDPWTLRLLERFAALVAKHEREVCANVCDERERANLYGLKECAAAIRERGVK
jgi:hypothetical protein